MPWQAVLPDERAIADYVARFSPYDVCTEQIEELYKGCKAVLVWRALNTLNQGDTDTNLPENARQKACDELRLKSMPPLLVDDDEIVDGNHRFRSLQKRGKTHFWVYEIQEI